MRDQDRRDARQTLVRPPQPSFSNVLGCSRMFSNVLIRKSARSILPSSLLARPRPPGCSSNTCKPPSSVLMTFRPPQPSFSNVQECFRMFWNVIVCLCLHPSIHPPSHHILIKAFLCTLRYSLVEGLHIYLFIFLSKFIHLSVYQYIHLSIDF